MVGLDSPVSLIIKGCLMGAISTGDIVLTHKLRWRKILASEVVRCDDIYTIRTAVRKFNVKLTHDARLYTQDGWVSVEDLDRLKHKVGYSVSVSFHDNPENIVQLDSDLGEDAIILSPIKEIRKYEGTYDFKKMIVSDDNSYSCDGLIVHDDSWRK